VNDWAEGIAQIVRAYVDDQVVALRAENQTLRELVYEARQQVRDTESRMVALESQDNVLRAALTEAQQRARDAESRLTTLESQDFLSPFAESVAREFSHV
jgi:uncharacterized membrane protein